MDFALAVTNWGVIIFNLGYMYNVFKELANILTAKIPDISILEWKVRFSFALVLLDGLCCVLGGGSWFVWILWIALFVFNLNSLKKCIK